MNSFWDCLLIFPFNRFFLNIFHLVLFLLEFFLIKFFHKDSHIYVYFLDFYLIFLRLFINLHFVELFLSLNPKLYLKILFYPLQNFEFFLLIHFVNSLIFKPKVCFFLINLSLKILKVFQQLIYAFALKLKTNIYSSKVLYLQVS